MSVEASEIRSEVWTRWQGYVINGVFPLGRYLGCSERSGVFLTRIAARAGPVAIKLVPTNRALAESQLPRWKRASGLAHPHLLGLLEWGGCQLDGLPYLYAILEYADQTLAQVLLHRALTDQEAKEMLLPTLDALAFLHSRNMVQGQLKPANILVVGDKLKLASDTIRRTSEGMMSANVPTVSDPPESERSSSSAAGDVWGLGISLFEALTRHPPAGLGEHRQPVVLPADFSQEFRDVVARCLSLSPEDRPTVSELIAWIRGQSSDLAQAPTFEPVQIVSAEPAPPQIVSPQVIPAAAPPASTLRQSHRLRALFAVTLGAAVIVALCWNGLRVFRAHQIPIRPSPPVQAPAESTSQTPVHAAAKDAADVPAPVSAATTTDPAASDAVLAPAALHQVMPDVPPNARRTIRGHIKVWVRVMVDKDGSVSSAVVDRTGPSRYFQRLAIEAAKGWTFPPGDSASIRRMQVRFDFSRDGTTGQAVSLH